MPAPVLTLTELLDLRAEFRISPMALSKKELAGIAEQLFAHEEFLRKEHMEDTRLVDALCNTQVLRDTIAALQRRADTAQNALAASREALAAKERTIQEMRDVLNRRGRQIESLRNAVNRLRSNHKRGKKKR